MGYIRLDEQPGEVYHYTHRKNLDSILRDGRIRRMGDRECWFCASLEDTLTLMRATVMMEGKPYYMGIASVQNPFTDRNMPYEQPFQPDAGDAEAVPIFVILSPIC